MKIKMTASLSGLDYSLQPGDVTDRFDTVEAGRLITAGFAAPYAEEPPVERAVRKPVTEKRRKASR